MTRKPHYFPTVQKFVVILAVFFALIAAFSASSGSIDAARKPTRTPRPTKTATVVPTSTATLVPTAVPTSTVAQPTPTSTVTATAYDLEPCLSTEEQALLDLINDYRAQNALTPVQATRTLNSAADYHSEDMRVWDYLSHTLHDGTSWSQNILNFGYPPNQGMGENLGKGFPTAQSIFDGWKGSEGHNLNMLNPDWKAVGIGQRGYFWTLDLATLVDTTNNDCASLTPTAINTPANTATNTPVPPTSTSTAVPPTSTTTAVPATSTPIPPTATATTVPTSTATATSTPTATATATQVNTNEIIVENGQSIQAALDRATAGQTIRVKGGTYALSATLTTRTNGVTVTAYDDTPVIIDGRNVVEDLLSVAHANTFRSLTFKNSAGAYGDVIVVTGDGAILEDITGSGANQAIINVKSTADQTRIEGCDLSDAATGVQISGTNVVVNACRFHDLNRMVNDSGDCSGAHGAQGVAVNNSRGPVLITNSIGEGLKTASVCYGTDGAFAELYFAQNVTIQGNLSSFGDVFVESNGDTSGNRILDNIVSNEPFLTLHQANGMTITGNLVTDMTANMYMGGSTAGIEFAHNEIGGSSRFFWISQTIGGSFHDNIYSFTGTDRFGYHAGTYYSLASAWVAALESGAQPTPTASAVPTQTSIPTATPGGSGTPTATSTATPSASPTPSGDPVVVVAVGDIACEYRPTTSGDTCHYGVTSDLAVAAGPDHFLMLGDAQYEFGTQANFNAYYDPTWGRLKGITWATAGGSHDYYGGGYFSTYFGARAGEPLKNWYAVDLGNGWRLINLASYCDRNGNCFGSDPETSMQAWLAKELAEHPSECTIAMWHEPRYTSDTRHDNEARMDVFWDMLVNAGVEINLTGHQHAYERMGPVGTSDNSTANGMTAFVVGTGGKWLEDSAPAFESFSRAYNQDTFGILKLVLYTDHAEFEFIPEPGKTFTDSGTIPCH